jgi:hypothetical protein
MLILKFSIIIGWENLKLLHIIPPKYIFFDVREVHFLVRSTLVVEKINTFNPMLVTWWLMNQ